MPAAPLAFAAAVAGVLARVELAGAGDAAAAAEVEAGPGPPAGRAVPAPHPAATSEAAARTSNRVRMPCRRRNRARGCARRPPPGVTHTMIKDNSNKRLRLPAGAGHGKAGMTSLAKSSADRRVSANVMSPNANSSEK